MLEWLILIVGLTLVTVGADVFVAGASGLAKLARISPLIIGLTVVALGTSAPEIAVNVTAGLHGQAGIAAGNVIGSNILNILLVLGLAASLRPLIVHSGLVRRDVPVLIVSTGLFVAFAWDGNIQLFEAVILLITLAGYTFLQIRSAQQERNTPQESSEDAPPTMRFPGASIRLLIGVVTLVFGSNLLVDSASTLAHRYGVEERVVGLTVVALGTSLPELATSIAATLRGQRDLAVGNVVGSNIYNTLVVVGLTGAVAPSGLPVPEEALLLDIPVMVGATLLCWPVFAIGKKMLRWEGISFTLYYLSYLSYVVLSAMEHQLAATAGFIALTVIIPACAVLIVVTNVRASIRPPSE